MKSLTFQARTFRWSAHAQTLPDGAADPAAESVEAGVEDAVVAFLHVEAADCADDGRASSLRRTLKHLKWLANKRELRTVVLHSFTHLGGDNASADDARAFLTEVAERLEGTGYTVATTPFGWFCAWQLDVFGDSLAKVWKAW